MYCVTVLRNGWIASGSADKTIKLWDPETEKCVKTLKGHECLIRSVAPLGDDRLVSCSDDKTIKVWDLKTKKCVHTLKGHTDWVRCVAELPAGAYPDGDLISVSSDRTLRIWNSEREECLETLEAAEVNMERMNLSRANLTDGLDKLLRQNQDPNRRKR